MIQNSEINNFTDINKLYELIPKKILDENNIDTSNVIKSIITEDHIKQKNIFYIMEIIIKAIKKNLFNYKKYIINYNLVEIIIELTKYKNIIDTFKNYFSFYNMNTYKDKKLIKLTPINI